jgi:hypothetical protein
MIWINCIKLELSAWFDNLIDAYDIYFVKKQPVVYAKTGKYTLLSKILFKKARK